MKYVIFAFCDPGRNLETLCDPIRESKVILFS